MGLGKPHQPANFDVATFSHCRNIKRKRPNLGSSSSPGPRHTFPLGVILWWALANPNCILNLKSLASAVTEILKGNPNISGSSQAHDHAHFFLGGIVWWALAKPTCLPILKSLSSIVAEILKGNPKFWGASLAQGHAHFLLCNFMMGPGKPKLHIKFEVASFSRCKNINGELQNFGELP